MPITKQKKTEILKNLKSGLKDAKIVIFVNFHGLTVSAESELRSALRGAGASYTVAKKTLIKKAFEEAGIEGDMPELEGEVALAYSSEDPIAPAKELKDFAKKSGIKLLGGAFENKFINSETVVMLANIPPREILLGQFVNVLNSPIQGTVSTLGGVISKFVRTLDAISKK